MKIIFMGTPDFAVRTLSRLCEAGHDVCTVITQPDRPHGRKLTVTAGPVAAEALRRGIPLLQPARIRGNEEVIAQIRGLAPDAIVVASFGQIIPQDGSDRRNGAERHQEAGGHPGRHADNLTDDL